MSEIIVSGETLRPMSLKAGDIVQLKSGGPLMTVFGMWSKDDDMVKCQWFMAPPYELKEGIFAANSLKAGVPQ